VLKSSRISTKAPSPVNRLWKKLEEEPKQISRDTGDARCGTWVRWPLALELPAAESGIA